MEIKTEIKKEEAQNGVANGAANGVAKEEKPQVELPLIQVPFTGCDKVSGCFWVGIPLNKFDVIEAVALLDQAKIHVVGYYKQRMIANQLRIQKPGFIQNLKSFVSGR